MTGFRAYVSIVLLTLSLLAAGSSLNATDTERGKGNRIGQDVLAVFSRAHQGAPLRYVAIGGSITQASGDGWIGNWLAEQFSKSNVVTINSGMSGTGSDLGVFRVERDVIHHQPDLVAIEFCVNDGGQSDESVIRNMESLIARLKQLQHPPAIIILEAASEKGVNLTRHRQVARHYGLLEVDLQRAIDEHLGREKRAWNSLFSDAVHLKAEGNRVYAEAIKNALKPFVEKARHETQTPDEECPLPRPLSAKPLLLDGKMINLASYVSAKDWRTQSSLNHSWTRFFNGTLVAEKPKAVLSIPVRGSVLGFLNPRHEDFAPAQVSLNGALPGELDTNSRGGYSTHILGVDLPAREHTLTVVTSEATGKAHPVHLGYLLVAGDRGAGREQSPQGKWGSIMKSEIQRELIPMTDFRWAGVYPGGNGIDAQSGINTAFPPEEILDGSKSKSDDAGIVWRSFSDAPFSGETVFDLRPVVSATSPSVLYARTKIQSDKETDALLLLRVDYFAKVWLNGECVAIFDSGHGPVAIRQYILVKLREGENDLLIKVGSGSAGFGFALEIGRIY